LGAPPPGAMAGATRAVARPVARVT
jgi:hypothetical protein